MRQSNNQAVGLPVCQSVGRLVNQSAIQSTGPEVSQSVSQSVSQYVSESVVINLFFPVNPHPPPPSVLEVLIHKFILFHAISQTQLTWVSEQILANSLNGIEKP